MPCRDHRWNHHVTPSNQLSFLVILSARTDILRIKGNSDRLKFKLLQSLHTAIGFMSATKCLKIDKIFFWVHLVVG